MANSKIHFIAKNKEYQIEITMVQTWYYCTNNARTINPPLLEHNTVSVALSNIPFMIAPPLPPFTTATIKSSTIMEHTASTL